MNTTADSSMSSVRQGAARARTHEGARGVGLIGLAARGLLYLVLAWLGVQLVIGSSREQVDTRGALHQLGREGAGKVALVLLVLGFAGFALWHVITVVGDVSSHEGGRALADAGRAVVYGILCALSVSFLVAPKPSGNTDQVDQTWTAKVLGWTGGPVLVGVVGVALIGGGLFLLWRAVTGGPIDEPSVLEVAPRETDAVHTLGAVGNLARGAIVVLIGIFVLVAAIQYDPTEAVGLDGTLKKLLDASYGGVLVVVVAAGLAAFGVYSVLRAWINRPSMQTSRDG